MYGNRKEINSKMAVWFDEDCACKHYRCVYDDDEILTDSELMETYNEYVQQTEIKDRLTYGEWVEENWELVDWHGNDLGWEAVDK